MELFGEKFTKLDVLKRVGDISQLADIREGELSSGRADGMKVLDVKTGGGLRFCVMPSRAMDISWASYNEMPLAHISKSGIVKPEFYEKDSRSFLRSFSCGLLTSCGMTQMGTPCQCDGEELGLHGRLSNIPAYEVFAEKHWEGDEYIMRLGGKVRESRLFGENMELSRVLETRLGSRKFRITDTVTNYGFTASPLMLLYHINLGYPLVSGNSKMKISCPSAVVPRDQAAQEGLGDILKLTNPVSAFKEQVFFHNLDKNSEKCRISVFNEKLSFGLYVEFLTAEFPDLCHWKMMGEGDYVLGIEPCTVPPIGRKRAQEQGVLPMLEPQQARQFHLEFGIITSVEDFEK